MPNAQYLPPAPDRLPRSFAQRPKRLGLWLCLTCLFGLVLPTWAQQPRDHSLEELLADGVVLTEAEQQTRQQAQAAAQARAEQRAADLAEAREAAERNPYDDLPNVQPADAYPTTEVIPHLEAPLAAGRNYLYCGTLKLAYDASPAAGQPADSPLTAALERLAFSREDLDADSTVILQGTWQEFVDAVAEKFPQAELGEDPGLPEPSGYAYLLKLLPFAEPFDRMTVPLMFQTPQGEVAVECFGLQDQLGKALQLDQVRVLDYRGPDDFVIEFVTTAERDHLILAKVPPGDTMEATLTGIEARRAEAYLPHDLRARIQHDEDFLVPCLAVGVQENFQAGFLPAVQVIRFLLNENGAVLESWGGSGGFGDIEEETEPREFIFDKPFLVYLVQEESVNPYFAAWIANAEFMLPSQTNRLSWSEQVELKLLDTLEATICTVALRAGENPLEDFHLVEYCHDTAPLLAALHMREATREDRHMLAYSLEAMVLTRELRDARREAEDWLKGPSPSWSSPASLLYFEGDMLVARLPEEQQAELATILENLLLAAEWQPGDDPHEQPKFTVGNAAYLEQLARREVNAALEQPIDFRGAGIPLAAALEHLATMYELNLTLDREAIAQAGIDLNTQVHREFKETPLGDVLARIASDAGLGLVYEVETIRVTTAEVANARPLAAPRIIEEAYLPLTGLEVREGDTWIETRDFEALAYFLETLSENGRAGGNRQIGPILIVQGTPEEVEVLRRTLAVLRQIEAARRDGQPLADPLPVFAAGTEARGTAILAALEQQGDFQFSATPLSEVVITLSNEFDITVVLNQEKLPRVNPDVQITCDLWNVSLGTFLAEILSERGLGCHIQNGELEITMQRAANDDPQLVIYPACDLPGVDAELEDVSYILYRNVTDDNWAEVGGTGYIGRWRGLLLVLQSPEMHSVCEDALEQLHEARALMADWDGVTPPPTCLGSQENTEQAEDAGSTGVYPVFDLTALPPQEGRGRGFSRQQMGDLTEGLKANVAPESWQHRSRGSLGTLGTGILVVAQSPENHALIEAYLETLRAAQAPSAP